MMATTFHRARPLQVRSPLRSHAHNPMRKLVKCFLRVPVLVRSVRMGGAETVKKLSSEEWQAQ
jgi:hypothetical protein